MNESKGALTEAVYYILISLYTPLHGYGVIQNVENLSGGRVRLGAGTLYGALNTLLSRGWIVECGDSGDRKKEYIITESGKRAVHDEIDRLQELLENGRRVLEALKDQ
ncbi:MAG: PadR family transcriptional regulator [Clostridia bacterium]|nr:PadR family transcriptional regulator [Clostridia bacterium]